MRKLLVGLVIVALVAMLLGCKPKAPPAAPPTVPPAAPPIAPPVEPVAKDIEGVTAVEKEIAPQDLDTLDKDVQAIEEAFK